MTKSDFQQLKKQINLLIRKLEDEAIEEEIDITSEEWQKVVAKIKEELLKRAGLTLEQYNELLELYQEKKTEKFADMLETFKAPNEKEVREIAEAISSKAISEFRPEIPAPQIINKIVKIIEKPQIIKTKEVVKEVDEETKKDLLKLQSDFSDFRKKTAEELSEFSMKGSPFLQKMKEGINKQNEERIKQFLKPEQLVMMIGNLQHYVDQNIASVRNEISTEDLWDRTGTLTYLKNTGDTFGFDSATYLGKDGSLNMTFTDAVTGTKTLAELMTGSGANTALSNLASVAINTSLVSDADNTDDLGSSVRGWKTLYLSTSIESLGDDLNINGKLGGGRILITGAGSTGDIIVKGGSPISTAGAGAKVQLLGGSGGSVSGNAGGVEFIGGTPVDGAGGGITLNATDGVGTNRSGGNVLFITGDKTGSGTAGQFRFAPKNSQVSSIWGVLDFDSIATSIKTYTFQNASGTLYQTGGTDVALADGGTGASLSDPNADKLLGWDDSAGNSAWFGLGIGLSADTTPNLNVIRTFVVSYINVVASSDTSLINDRIWTDETISSFGTQLDVPRTVRVLVTPQFSQTMTGTLTVNGTDADGASINEVFTINDASPRTYNGSKAFAVVTSVVVDQTDATSLSRYSVGNDNKLGLPNYPFNATGDVFKINKNGVHYASANYTIDATYGTMADSVDISPGNTDDYEFWFRPYK